MTTMVEILQKVFAKCQVLESSRIPVSSAIGRFSTCILCAGVAVGHSILELIGDLIVTAMSDNRASLSKAVVSLSNKPGGCGKGEEGGDTEEHLKEWFQQRGQMKKEAMEGFHS